MFSIEHTRYRPRPDTYGFWRLFRKHRLRPAACIMVEDSRENPQTAKRLGMKTVWLTSSRNVPAHVDVSIKSVMQLPRMLGRLRQQLEKNILMGENNACQTR